MKFILAKNPSLYTQRFGIKFTVKEKDHDLHNKVFKFAQFIDQKMVRRFIVNIFDIYEIKIHTTKGEIIAGITSEVLKRVVQMAEYDAINNIYEEFDIRITRLENAHEYMLIIVGPHDEACIDPNIDYDGKLR